MGCEQENKNDEEGRHAGQVAPSEAGRRSGEDQRTPLQSADMDRLRATLREAPVSAPKRSAERRQTSALIAWWGDVERRSGADRRDSPSGDGIDQD